VAPPSSSASKPGRLLAALVAIIVLLLLAVVGGNNLASPGKWSHSFHILLGLDLTSGTQVSLKAEAPHGKPPSTAEMAEAVTIMLNRVDAGGFTEASVVPQGTNIINVSVPGQNSQSVVKLVEQTAELLFRQVLLIAPNKSSVTPTPTPSATGTPSPSPSGSASSTPKATPTASTKAFVRGGAPGGVAEMARGARGLRGDTAVLTAAAKPSPTPSAGATPSTSATPSSTASPAASATPNPSASATAPATAANGTTPWQTATGDATKVSAQAKAEFNKLNCADKNWQKEIGYNPQIWNDANRQIVSCGNIGGTGSQYQAGKFVLAPAKVVGAEIKSASASTQQGTVFWQVNLNFKPAGSAAFGTLTTQMYDTYGKSGSPLDDLAADHRELRPDLLDQPGQRAVLRSAAAQLHPAVGGVDQPAARS
jgi:preprotein translocase subunit SecD